MRPNPETRFLNETGFLQWRKSACGLTAVESSGDRETASDVRRPFFLEMTEKERMRSRLASLPLIRDRVPARYRPALILESFYNVGTGAFVCLFLLSTVVLKTIIGGTATHLALLAILFGGSSLFSPLVSWLGREFSMRSLVVYPNLLVAALLLVTISPVGGATLFTLIVGAAFIVRVFPRVGEMNMYRVNYPVTHRGAAVGWVKAVSAVSALTVTLTGYWWFTFQPDYYWVVYWLVAILLFVSTLFYARLPISKNNVFARDDAVKPHDAFFNGLKIFLADRRFLCFQGGFALAGFANHMAMVYVAEVLREDVIVDKLSTELVPQVLQGLLLETWNLDRQSIETLIVGLVFAVLPVMFMMISAPFWGRFLDRTNPMIARAIFNTFQWIAYSLHAYGAMTLQVWPFLVGAIIHAIGNGGGTINWLTGSLYFARNENISLYNAIHVGLTGVRGLLAPLFGFYLISSQSFDLYLFRVECLDLGGGIFWVAAGLSLIGALVMLIQGLTDPGPRE
jgi:hypothetical protein